MFSTKFLMEKKENNSLKKFKKYPINIHPLIALISSSLIFLVGAFNHSSNLWIFFIFIILIYFFFGLYKFILKLLPIIMIFSLFFYIIYYLYTFDLKIAFMQMTKIQILIMSLVPTLSFKTKELTIVLKQLKFPNQLILGIQIIYKFIPVLKKELKNINKARKVRNLKFKLKNIYRAYIIPFLYKLSIISDNISLSIETRGYTLNKSKNIYYKIILDIVSILFLILIIFITIYYLVYLKDLVI